jgi:hypothetical protein
MKAAAPGRRARRCGRRPRRPRRAREHGATTMRISPPERAGREDSRDRARRRHHDSLPALRRYWCIQQRALARLQEQRLLPLQRIETHVDSAGRPCPPPATNSNHDERRLSDDSGCLGTIHVLLRNNRRGTWVGERPTSEVCPTATPARPSAPCEIPSGRQKYSRRAGRCRPGSTS